MDYMAEDARRAATLILFHLRADPEGFKAVLDDVSIDPRGSGAAVVALLVAVMDAYSNIVHWPAGTVAKLRAEIARLAVLAAAEKGKSV